MVDKKEIKIFVSYAHKNKLSANELLDKLVDHLNVMKNYKISIWWDKDLIIGNEWNKEILNKLKKCDLALLLVSPPFLHSNFIMETEVPILLQENKLIVLAAISQLDYNLHDFKGLDKYQIYHLNKQSFKQPRSYNELKRRNKDLYALELARIIKEKLDKSYN